jgi:hypothetical protein
MDTRTYWLPAHWASALVNGDTTGLDDADENMLDWVMTAEGLPAPIACGEEPEFRKYHDAQPYGVLACDCLEYTFPGS